MALHDHNRARVSYFHPALPEPGFHGACDEQEYTVIVTGVGVQVMVRVASMAL